MDLELVVMVAQPGEYTKNPQNCTLLKRSLSVAIYELHLNKKKWKTGTYRMYSINIDSYRLYSTDNAKSSQSLLSAIFPPGRQFSHKLSKTSFKGSWHSQSWVLLKEMEGI